MSKRYGRRPRNPNLPQEAFSTPVSAPVTTGGGQVAQAAAPTARHMNWREEYSEVIGDLRKTALIFVGLVAAMVVLSFVIR